MPMSDDKRPPVPRNPPLPVYDPATGQNPFAWIVATAPKVREARNLADFERRKIKRQRDRLDYRPARI